MKTFFLATCISILISLFTINGFAKEKNRRISSNQINSQIETENAFDDEPLTDKTNQGYEMKYTPRARSTKFFSTQGFSIRAFAASISIATKIKP